MPLRYDEEGKVIVPSGIESERAYSINTIIINVRGVEFTFDKETAEKFKREFDTRGEAYVGESDYLCRRNSKGKKESFHRWLMQKEIEEFCKIHEISEDKVEVHHKSLNHKDNRKENLECQKVADHKNIHKEEKHWIRERKKLSGFWPQGINEKKMREQHKHHWNVTHPKKL
jgi:hypothetical protein